MTEPDWKTWTPAETAALCFVVSGGRILLIHKKRGLGAGKVNGPGGRREPGESAEDCARRETMEEVGVEPRGLVRAGELRFQFVDGYALLIDVFTASSAVGEPRASDEADPFWADVSAVPYAEMWPDDAIWLPEMLAGRPFRGRFHFDGDKLLSYAMEPL